MTACFAVSSKGVPAAPVPDILTARYTFVNANLAGVYGLPAPPYGAVWVRVGNDALLVDEDSDEVITVEYSVFY